MIQVTVIVNVQSHETVQYLVTLLTDMCSASHIIECSRNHFYRPQSLRRLCFYTCLSFCPWGVGGGGIPGCLAGGIPACLAGLLGGILACLAGGVPACLAGLLGGILACLAGFQAHTQGGAWGVWPEGGLQAHTQGGLHVHMGGVSQHALRQSPLHSWWLLLWAVRILLECILVFVVCILTCWTRLNWEYYTLGSIPNYVLYVINNYFRNLVHWSD